MLYSRFFLNYQRLKKKGHADKIPRFALIFVPIGIVGAIMAFLGMFLIPDSFLINDAVKKIFFGTMLYMVGLLLFLFAFQFIVALVCALVIPSGQSNLLIRCTVYVLRAIVFAVVLLAAVDNYHGLFVSYFDETGNRGIKNDFHVMVTAAKDMGSSELKITAAHLTSTPYLSGYNGKNFVLVEVENSTGNIIKLKMSKSDINDISESKLYDITYFENTGIITESQEYGDYVRESEAETQEQELLKRLLDQNIEITLSVEDKKSGYGSIVFINRPEIEFYDVEHKHHLIPPEDDIYFYLKRDGEMYEVFSASSKTKFNDLTFIAQRWEYGNYEITLVFGKDHIPISNTIRYTLDDGYHFSEEYESIPLKK